MLCPLSAIRAKEVRIGTWSQHRNQVDSVLPADGWRPARPRTEYPACGAGASNLRSHLIHNFPREGRGVREADGRIKPGAQALGSNTKEETEPAERATALPPVSRAQLVFLCFDPGAWPQALRCHPLRGLRAHRWRI